MLFKLNAGLSFIFKLLIMLLIGLLLSVFLVASDYLVISLLPISISFNGLVTFSLNNLSI